MINRNTFCVLPWIHSFVNSNGAYQVCCTSEEHHEGIPDPNDNYYNIKNKPKLEDVRNAEFMKSLRLKMLSGEWDKICTRCFETERLDGTSRRMIENSEHQSLLEELIKSTHEDGTIKNQLQTLDYRLGNKCNLECRMCGVFSSEKWVADWNKVKPAKEALTEEQLNDFRKINWPEDPYLVEEFRGKQGLVERIHFGGGEPLISKQMTALLQECVTSGLSKNITLSYNTNITVLPKDVLHLWKEFKGVKLLCSVDGFNEINEYIRYPSNWGQVDKNLHFLDENFNELGLVEVLLSTTVQIYNVLNLNELYNYVSGFRNITPALNLINLHFPIYLSSQVLPPGAKKIATERLVKIAKSLDGTLLPEQNYLLENIYQIINFMNERDLSKKLGEFKKTNKKFDELKNVKFSKSLPELNELLITHYLDHADV